MKNKLKLGYGVSLPFNTKSEIPEYAEDNIKLIRTLSSNFDCIQVMFSKLKLTSNELKQIKFILSDYKYIYIHSSYQINMGAGTIARHLANQ